MKQVLIALFAVLFFFSGCASADTASLQAENDKLKSRIEELEKKVESSQESLLENEIDVESSSECQAKDTDVIVTVIGKTNIPEDIHNGRFSDRGRIANTSLSPLDNVSQL